MANDEHFSEEPCRNRAYNMIMQHYLQRCYKEYQTIALQHKFGFLTHLTKINLQAYLKSFSLHRECLLLIHEKL